MKATIVENSLADKSILKSLAILRTHQSENWILHEVLVEKNQIPDVQKSLAGGPWYIHLWSDEDEILIIFKERVFAINKKDRSTWKEAIDFGKELGIPEEQLDFVTH